MCFLCVCVSCAVLCGVGLQNGENPTSGLEPEPCSLGNCCADHYTKRGNTCSLMFLTVLGLWFPLIVLRNTCSLCVLCMENLFCLFFTPAIRIVGLRHVQVVVGKPGGSSILPSLTCFASLCDVFCLFVLCLLVLAVS